MKVSFTLLFIVLLLTLNAQNPVPARTKGDMTAKPDAVQTAIIDSRTSLAKLTTWLDEWEVQLNPGTPTTETSNLNLSKSNINRQSQGSIIRSRSNIKNVALSIDNVANSDRTMRDTLIATLHNALTELNSSIDELNQTITGMGESYATKAAELKNRYDTVKNSIGNIR